MLLFFNVNFILDITASLLGSLVAAISVFFFTGILHVLGNYTNSIDWNFIVFCFIENAGQDRVHAVRPANNNNNIPLATPQVIVPRHSNTAGQANNQRSTPVKKREHVDRATSPVDERILNEFYLDRSKDVHQYNLEGRQYVVYEGANLTDIETYRTGK